MFFSWADAQSLSPVLPMLKWYFASIKVPFIISINYY